jgi:hypothetical protein
MALTVKHKVIDNVILAVSDTVIVTGTMTVVVVTVLGGQIQWIKI